MTASISNVASVLPDTRVKVAELPEVTSLAPPQRAVYDQLGIDTIGVDDSMTAADLAAEASRRVLATTPVDPAAVDVLLTVQSRVPEYLMASEATSVQAAVGATNATTFGIAELGCVSINAALITADALLSSQPQWQTVLVAHGSKAPAPRHRYRHPVTINGEGGVACLVTRSGPNRVLEASLETNGEYWDLFRVDYKDKPTVEWVEACTSAKAYSFKLAIESRNRFQRLVDETLGRHGLGRTDVAWMMQNLSGGAFRFYEEFFGVAMTRSCWDNLRQWGHLGSMDIPLNLQVAVENGEVSPGDRVIILNNSPVAAWSVLLVEV